MGKFQKPSARLMLEASDCVYTKCPPNIDTFKLIHQTHSLAIYVDSNTKRIVVSLRGTNLSSIKDLKADVQLTLKNLASSQRYREDLAKVKESIAHYPGYVYYFTGHSLGGAIAQQLMRDVQGEAAMVFNSAYQNIDVAAPNESRVTRFHIKGDPLTPASSLRKHVKILDNSGFHARKALGLTASIATPLATLPLLALNSLNAHQLKKFKPYKKTITWS